MCYRGFKKGVLWSGPLLKMGDGGFQNWPTRVIKGFRMEINVAVLLKNGVYNAN